MERRGREIVNDGQVQFARERFDVGDAGQPWHAPSVFWFVGGSDPDVYTNAKSANRLNELPVNHSPKFAPIIHPTLRTGIEALVVAARAWLLP